MEMMSSLPPDPDVGWSLQGTMMSMVGAATGDDTCDDTGDDTGELEPEDTLLSDLPHPVSHTTSNCNVKRGVEHTKSGDRRKAKHTLDKT